MRLLLRITSFTEGRRHKGQSEIQCCCWLHSTFLFPQIFCCSLKPASTTAHSVYSQERSGQDFQGGRGMKIIYFVCMSIRGLQHFRSVAILGQFPSRVLETWKMLSAKFDFVENILLRSHYYVEWPFRVRSSTLNSVQKTMEVNDPYAPLHIQPLHSDGGVWHDTQHDISHAKFVFL